MAQAKFKLRTIETSCKVIKSTPCKESPCKEVVPYNPLQNIYTPNGMITRLGVVILLQTRMSKVLIDNVCGDIIASLNCRWLFTKLEYQLVVDGGATIFGKARKLVSESDLTRAQLRVYVLSSCAALRDTIVDSLKFIDLE